MSRIPENPQKAVHEDTAILLEYSARKLDAADTTRVEAHLKSCTACLQIAAGHRAVWEALDSWEAAPLSSDFNRRLYQRIEKEVSWLDLLMRPFRPLFLRHGLPVAATACLLLVAGVLLQRPPELPRAQQRPDVRIELSPAQTEAALQEMEMLREISRLTPANTAAPRM